jgi:hypothetical protein
MEIARYDGMIEGARARAEFAKQQINALEIMEA